jgi:hypothetical protein
MSSSSAAQARDAETARIRKSAADFAQGFNVAVAVGFLAAGLHFVDGRVFAEHIVPAPTKPFADFQSFYEQRYLPEHSQEGTRALHVVGTCALFVLLMRTPNLMVALLAGLWAGLAAFPLLRGLESGLPEMALMLGVYLFVGTKLTGSLGATFLVPAVSYGFAWAGHFFVEHNRPATFVYPTFSLLGDLMMVYTAASKGSLAF